jgi:hypothetical protein
MEAISRLQMRHFLLVLSVQVSGKQGQDAGQGVKRVFQVVVVVPLVIVAALQFLTYPLCYYLDWGGRSGGEEESESENERGRKGME